MRRLLVACCLLPLDIVLLDRQGRTQFVFPRRYRNFVSFCPFGQMAVVAGFGNLAGEKKKESILSSFAFFLAPHERAPAPCGPLVAASGGVAALFDSAGH